MNRLVLQPPIGLPAPIGHVHLYQAVNAVGGAARGTDWVSVCCQFDLKHQLDANSAVVDAVVKQIAKACEAGTIEAGYPTPAGTVDALDRCEWQKPHRRNYFRTGTIDLHDLPLLDDRLRPVPDGRTAPVCNRKIFIREDSLDNFVSSLTPQAVATSRYPSDAALIEEGRRLVAGGMERRAAARKLAPRAEGAGTLESKVDRLRKAF